MVGAAMPSVYHPSSAAKDTVCCVTIVCDISGQRITMTTGSTLVHSNIYTIIFVGICFNDSVSVHA